MLNGKFTKIEKPSSALCVYFAHAKNGAVNLYTPKLLKTNELLKIKNIFFLIEDFDLCFVYRGSEEIINSIRLILNGFRQRSEFFKD